MINAAFIGAGRMAGCHAGCLKDMDGVKLHGVYDPAAETAKKFVEKFDIPRNYGSFEELAADPAVDAVLACNFSDQHYRTLTELFKAGKKNVFCEKALVRQLADGEDLVRQAEKIGARVMVGHHRRYQAGYARLQELIAAGKLGRIRMAKVAYCHPGYAREWGDFFADFERSGGVILDMMTHLFDQLNWYFGEPANVSADALMFDRSQPLPVDFVSATLTYRNGVICNIDGSWQRYGVGYDRIEIYGDQGCALYDQGNKLHIYRPGEHTELLLGDASAYAEQMKAFVAMATDGIPPRTGLRDGFNSVRVALKTIDAVKKKQTLSF